MTESRSLPPTACEKPGELNCRPWFHEGLQLLPRVIVTMEESPSLYLENVKAPLREPEFIVRAVHQGETAVSIWSLQKGMQKFFVLFLQTFLQI